jgi:LysR family nod box-dependent transcriptional activator
MRLDQFDLNLLIAFDVLLSERSVTHAARRLNLTQSAMSASLKRLRESLNDDILVQHGKKMIPTPRALDLAPEITSVLQRLRGLIASATTFDPGVSSRRFRIAASDYITTVLIAPLLKQLQAEAPGIELDISLPCTGSAKAMDDGELDLLLTPEQFIAPHHPYEVLFAERHVVIGCASNPVLRQPLTQERFFECGHVVVHIQGEPTFIEAALDAAGVERRVEIIAPSFIQAPWMLRMTSRLALMHERLAMLLAGPLSLAVQPCPIDLPAMIETMQYHSARANDQGLAWLRARLCVAANGSLQF